MKKSEPIDMIEPLNVLHRQKIIKNDDVQHHLQMYISLFYDYLPVNNVVSPP